MNKPNKHKLKTRKGSFIVAAVVVSAYNDTQVSNQVEQKLKLKQSLSSPRCKDVKTFGIITRKKES